MTVARKSPLLALCLGTILVFFAQSMCCFAKRAEFVSCGVHTEQPENPGDSDQQSPSSQAECCPPHSHTALVTIDAVSVPIEHVLSDLVLKSDDTVPDSPVREIDHPPQLS